MMEPAMRERECRERESVCVCVCGCSDGLLVQSWAHNPEDTGSIPGQGGAKCTGCASRTANGTGETTGCPHLQWEEVQSVLLRAPCPGSRRLDRTGT